MKELSEKMQFEEAEAVKKKYMGLEKLREKSEVVSYTIHDVDVFTIEADDKDAYINYLHVTNGVINQAFTFEYKKKINR